MSQHYDALIIGSGMGSLSTAVLLAKQGLKVIIIEQNYLPGGCTSSYWRKGFVFESGATTVVGVEPFMPLGHLLQQTGISLPYRTLPLPMQVHMPSYNVISRHQDIPEWTQEATNHFGEGAKQEKFWKFCHRLSQFVWHASLRYPTFPPSKVRDWVGMAASLQWKDPWLAGWSFKTIKDVLKKIRPIWK